MTNNFPPPGFVPAPSAVPGIELYQPAPPEGEDHRVVVTFHCPQCDATTAYSAAGGGLTCQHCSYYEPPKKPLVGKGAEEFEFTVTTVAQAAHGWGVARLELQCQRCGAATTVPAESLSHTCSFCGSNNVIQHKAPQDVLRPRFLVPFKLEAESCPQIVRDWLGSSWLTPGGLRRLAHLASFTPVYLPAWTFDATLQAAWRAEVGQTRSKRIFNPVTMSWQITTETVWRWESGTLHQVVDDLLIGGSARLSQRLLGGIHSYNLNELVVYEPKYLAGAQAQAYDLPLERAWETARSQMREAARLACRCQASTSKIRNFSMNLDFGNESWRYILLPVYVAAYSYQGRPYQVIINGQSGAIAGQRPADWLKVWLAVAAWLAPGFLTAAIGLFLATRDEVGFFFLMVSFGLFVFGMFGALTLLKKAQELDDA
ncbi:MAG: hypothetical protein L0332_27655 [Chloroflexi bacterium]|nr:hypothetical protein [Chloroflexota bacterium]MCI0580740.1 hypothetical protein [Chloroflexota bacterium]MCI0650011.1 hypothetical protein [Chloroflexota bacterium]MCI0730475.1 hypothetical protein [Chloroflexota bacterium]